jgi:antitoxin PrlF
MQWELIISAKGQVTIPKEMREVLDLRPGDQLIYSLIDGQIVVTPKNVNFNDLAGLLGKAPNGHATLDEIDQAVLKAAGSSVTDLKGDAAPDVAA